MSRRKSTHIDDPKAVGHRLKTAREQAGVSQRQLAFEGCSAAYISRVEAGDRSPSLTVLRELASRLGVSAEWLATGTEQSTSKSSNQLRDAEIALRFDDVDEAQQLFAVIIDTYEDSTVCSRALEGLSEVALRTGDPRRAVELAEEALYTTAEQPEQRPALAETLARAHAALGELAPAIAVLKRCRDHLADDVLQFVRFSTLLGAALTDAGNFSEAEVVIAHALARGREIVDPYARARLFWSQSRLLVEEGRSEDAEDYAQRTLETLRATEDEYSIGLILQTLAHINLDLGRPSDALDLLDEAWPKIAAVGTPLEVAQFQIERARALAGLGESNEAAALAMELTQTLGATHPTDAGRAYALLGETFAAVGDRARAREVLELAVEQLEQRPPSRYLVKAYKQLARLLREDGEVEQALELLERALGIQDAVGRPLS